ncbi:hypothetical protein SLEP1_g55756 [Rubroshorea leprosula]|uniref:Uncharacterized protein n=1 Tax=Rubroshorea leprosula TaxID=152421 RepID=A0AAV5MIX6_9ROSI|nr:hypothetical protein SLEP1_g55756 [Rubroshorea leprosula]
MEENLPQSKINHKSSPNWHHQHSQTIKTRCNQLSSGYKPSSAPPSTPISLLPEKASTMAAEMALVKPISKFNTTTTPKLSNPRPTRFTTVRMTATAPQKAGKPSKKAAKTAIKETLLTPRFYTTDFDEMETLFNTEINNNLNQSEFEALLQEFKTDYNQTHFVRNKEFKEAADKMQGPLRQIFVEFLERSCTAEFSGFLLYKELGRRLKLQLKKKKNPSFLFPFPNHNTTRLLSPTDDPEMNQ